MATSGDGRPVGRGSGRHDGAHAAGYRPLLAPFTALPPSSLQSGDTSRGGLSIGASRAPSLNGSGFSSARLPSSRSRRLLRGGLVCCSIGFARFWQAPWALNLSVLPQRPVQSPPTHLSVAWSGRAPDRRSSLSIVRLVSNISGVYRVSVQGPRMPRVSLDMRSKFIPTGELRSSWDLSSGLVPSRRGIVSTGCPTIARPCAQPS